MKSVPVATKSAFGLVALSMEMSATIYNTFELFFLTDVAMMPPSLAAWVGGVFRIWSSVSDPVVGALSDKTQSLKWGRRRGWLLGAALPYAILYLLTWIVPTHNAIGLCVYFLFIKCACDFAWSCIRVPYTAIINDLSTEYSERYRLNIIRFGASGFGSMFAAVLAAILSKVIKNSNVKFPVLAIVTGIALILSVLLLVYKTKQYSESESPKKLLSHTLWDRIRATMKVKTAVLVLIISSFSMIAMQSTVTFVPYLVEDYLLLNDFDVMIIMVTVLVSGFITILILYALSKKVEKRIVYFIGCSVWISFYLVIAAVNPHRVWLLYVLVPLMGSVLAGCVMTSTSMLNDAADFVELETGMKLEGMLLGFSTCINKLILGLVIFVFEQVINSTGFDIRTKGSKAVLPEKTLEAMKIMFVTIPCFFLVVAFICNYFIEISVPEMQRIQEQLKKDNQLLPLNEDYDRM